MATERELANARKLLDLDVHEVSLVDRPANERDFLIVKRKEDDMGAFEGDNSNLDPSYVGLTKASDSSSGEPGEETINKAKPDAEAIKSVADWMKKMSKGPGAPESVKAVAGQLEKLLKAEHGDDEEMKKAKGEMADDEEMKKGKGAEKADDEEMEKAKTKAEDGEGDEEYPFPGAKKSKAQKNADGPEPAVVIGQDGSVHVSGQPVLKAKGFTAPRKDALKAAFGALATLMKDVDEETMKSVIGDMAKGQLPNNAKLDSQVRPAGVKKADDEAEAEKAKAEKAKDEEIADLKKRLETIEKSRTPSKSVEGEGGNSEKVTKSGSMWSGVL